MWKQLEPHFANVEQTHNQMGTVGAYRTNYQQLLMFKNVFMANSKNMSSLGKYVTFGSLSVSNLLMTFADTDELQL
jgi:hypothetical protein